MVQIDKIGKNGKNWYSLVKMVKIAKHLLSVKSQISYKLVV
jgi:hypothetical protein